MFSYEEIQKYTETDIRIYKYIISNIDKIQYMTIRELAKEIHVSAATILRFCNKNNFDKYAEFKDALKNEITLQTARPPMEDLQELSDFFARANSSAFEEKLSFAFDLDGTIADTIPMCIKAFQNSVSPYADHELSREDILHTFGLNEIGMVKAVAGQNWEKAKKAVLSL